MSYCCRGVDNLASRIKFVAYSESRIYIFGHFQALIFACVTLHAYNLKAVFFFSCFPIIVRIFGHPSAVTACTLVT